MKEALEHGISRYQLYRLKDQGRVEQVSRGIYRLTDTQALREPDLVTVAMRAPSAVICLVSALAFHEITTQVPHAVSIALPKGSRSPRIGFPPIEVFRFSKDAFEFGVEEHAVDGALLRIYSPEKTIADSFKFRNKVGLDVALEALRLYKIRKPLRVQKLIEASKICRVENIIRPYLEAMTS